MMDIQLLVVMTFFMLIHFNLDPSLIVPVVIIFSMCSFANINCFIVLFSMIFVNIVIKLLHKEKEPIKFVKKPEINIPIFEKQLTKHFFKTIAKNNNIPYDILPKYIEYLEKHMYADNIDLIQKDSGHLRRYYIKH